EDYLPLGEIICPTLEEIQAESCRGSEAISVPTAFCFFTEFTRVMHPGQMVAVSACTAVCRSTFGIDIARAASINHKLPSVIFSLEMSQTEIAMRMLSAESEVPLQNMRKGMMRDEDWDRLARALNKVSDAPLFIDDSPNMSLMEIRAKCRRLKQRNDLKLVIIDY